MFLIFQFLLLLSSIFFLVMVLERKKTIYLHIAIICFVGFALLLLQGTYLTNKYYSDATISIIPIHEVYKGSNGTYYVKEDNNFYELKTAETCLGDDNYVIYKTYPNMKHDYSLLFNINKHNYTIVTKQEIKEFPKKEELK